MTTEHHKLCPQSVEAFDKFPCFCEPSHIDGPPENCPANECMICAVTWCPSKEPLHFHHDGCPVCSFVDHSQEGKEKV